MRDLGGKRAAAVTESRVTKMADQTPEFDGRARTDLPRAVFGMMAVLATAVVIGILFISPAKFCPNYAGDPVELSAGAGSATAPSGGGGPGHR